MALFNSLTNLFNNWGKPKAKGTGAFAQALDIQDGDIAPGGFSGVAPMPQSPQVASPAGVNTPAPIIPKPVGVDAISGAAKKAPYNQQAEFAPKPAAAGGVDARSGAGKSASAEGASMGSGAALAAVGSAGLINPTTGTTMPVSQNVLPTGDASGGGSPAQNAQTAGLTQTTTTQDPAPAPVTTQYNTGAEGAQEGQQQQQNGPMTQAQIVQMGQGFYNEFSTLIQQSSAEGQKYLADAFNSFMSSLDSTQQQITEMFKSQMGGVDQATLSALTQLREGAKESRRTMLEDLSRRGILQSGIAVKADIELDKNQLNAEQQMLSSRVADIQNRMTSMLMQFAQSRLDAIQRFGLAGADIAARSGEQSLGALQNSFSQAMNLSSFNENKSQADRAFAQAKSQYEAKVKLDAEQQRKLDAEKTAQQQRADQEKTAQQTNPATQTAIAAALQSGTREAAIQSLSQGNRVQQMIEQGVDIEKLWQYINKLPSAGSSSGSTSLEDLLQQQQ